MHAEYENEDAVQSERILSSGHLIGRFGRKSSPDFCPTLVKIANHIGSNGSKIEVLDLSHNTLGKEDLDDVISLLKLLPRVRDLDLSGWCLTVSCADKIQKCFEAAPTLNRIFVCYTDLCSFSGRDFFTIFSHEDISRTIFMLDPVDFESRHWIDMMDRRQYEAVVKAHSELFKDSCGNKYIPPVNIFEYSEPPPTPCRP